MQELIFKSRKNGFIGINRIDAEFSIKSGNIEFFTITSGTLSFLKRDLQKRIDEGASFAVCNFDEECRVVSFRFMGSIDDIGTCTNGALMTKESIKEEFGEGVDPFDSKIMYKIYEFFIALSKVVSNKVIGVRLYDDNLKPLKRDETKALELGERIIHTGKEDLRDFEDCYFFPAERLSDVVPNLKGLLGTGCFYLGTYDRAKDAIPYKNIEYRLCEHDIPIFFSVEDFGDTVILKTKDGLFSDYVEKADFFENLRDISKNIVKDTTYTEEFRKEFSLFSNSMYSLYSPYGKEPQFVDTAFEVLEKTLGRAAFAYS